MKNLIYALFFFPLISVANPSVEACVSNHFVQAQKEPDLPFEKDAIIVKIWCQCETQQRELGKNVYDTLAYCASSTNDAINKRLKLGPYRSDR